MLLITFNPVGNITATTIEQDLEYLSLIGFGTPPQYIPVDLDTGSTDVWVYSAGMAPKDTANRTGLTKWH